MASRKQNYDVKGSHWIMRFFGNTRSRLSPSARHQNWRNIQFLANFLSVQPNGKIRKFCNLHKLHVSPSFTSVMASKPMLFGNDGGRLNQKKMLPKNLFRFSLSLSRLSLTTSIFFRFAYFPLGAAVSFKHDVGKAANIVIGKKCPEEMFQDLFFLLLSLHWGAFSNSTRN